MGENHVWTLLLGRLIDESPLILVWLVGAGLALVRRRRHAGVSVLILCAIGLFALANIGHDVAVSQIQRRGMGDVPSGIWYIGIAFGQSLTAEA